MYTIILATILSAPPDGSFTRPLYTVPRQSSRQSGRRSGRQFRRSNTGILRPFRMRRANLQPIPKIKRIYLYETTIPQGVPFHTEYRFQNGHTMTIVPKGGNVLLDPIIMEEKDNQFKRKIK